MLPRLTFNQLALNIEKSVNAVSKDTASLTRDKMPVIPPKGSLETNGELPRNPDDVASWFVVMSPREIRGIAGPFSVPQLRQMYKYGELEDKTLLWSEGEDDWHQLIHQRILRPKLLQIPLLPPRIGSYNAELAVFDPIMKLPSVSVIRGAASLPDFELSKSCLKCGGIATIHLPMEGEQIPDILKCLDEVGTTQYASEILPGFLWIGNSGSSKKRSLLKLGVTLLINCGDNMHNPFSNPPFYRCKDAPLKEKPLVSNLSAEGAQELLSLFGRVFDWVELERLYPEYGSRSDLPPKEYRGTTDMYGLPAKKEKPFRKLQDDEKSFPSRVLLWSRLGTDRPCAVGASYLIRRYGISVERAMEIILRSRPTCSISNCYLAVLHQWAAKYVLGVMLCVDCQAEGLKLDSSVVVEGAKEFGALEDGSSADVVAAKDVHGLVVVAPSRAEDAEAFANLMKTHFPLLVKNAEEVRLLGDTTQYISRIQTGFSQSSAWSGLQDLDLGGRALSDLTVAILVQLLAGNNLIRSLRVLNLENNQVAHLAVKALLVAYFPIADLEEGEDYRLEEEGGGGHPRDADDDLDSVGAPQEDIELMSLDLSHNRLDEYGVKYLCYFVKQCNSLTALDVSDNALEDFLVADLVACLERPLMDFAGDLHSNNSRHHKHTAAVMYGDDDSIHSGEQLPLHNFSITMLSIGYNRLGPQAAEALGKMLKHNAVLTVLRMELSPALPPNGFKDISSSMRVYNSTLIELVLSHTPLTVKSAEYVARMLDSMDSRIERLELSCCGMKHQHMDAFAKYLLSSQHLSRLDLSGNALGDKGANHLSLVVRGQQDFNGLLCPPLQHLDLSTCNIQCGGCLALVTEAAGRSSLRLLDISHNPIGPTELVQGKGTDKQSSISASDPCAMFYDALSNTRIHELKMNACGLKSTGAVFLFSKLTDRANKLSQHVKSLHLSSNQISDSATTALCDMLERNNVLELLDLGFNEFTNASAEFFRNAVKVHSASERAKKICGLTVNMIGNKCDAYVFDTPGLSRSKNTLMFGLQANSHDSHNQGFSHISQRSRGNFLVRKKLNEEYRKHYPLEAINSAT